MAGISNGSATSNSAYPKWKHTSCTVKNELVIPDKMMRIAPDGRNVECSLNAEISMPTRSLVTSTCINSSKKSSFSKKTVSRPSQMKHICSESKAGGTYCIARWCGNNAKKSPGISLFRIPKDPDR
jgi:hypothetical protein